MKRLGLMALAGAALASIALADGTGTNKGWRGTAKSQAKGVSNSAENGLIGIKLYDTGLDVIRKFGSPDEIQDVASGTGASIGPTGGAGGGAGGRGGGGGGGGNRRSGGAGSSAAAEWNIPGIDFTPIGFQGEPPPRINAPASGGGGGGGSFAPQQGGGGQPAGQGGGAAAAGPDNRIVYTRWVYRKGNSRYAFVLNRYNQVIQIEAIGSNDPRVGTNRGVRYGTQFGDIMKKYGAPDGYEIAGNNLVVRYLVNSKVAFRLNRLKTDGKHVVTGIVVAAGKM